MVEANKDNVNKHGYVSKLKLTWSTNVLTNVLYFVDPKYMLTTGQYKLVNKSFKKAVEIVIRVSLNHSTRAIERNVDLVEKERLLWYKSAKCQHMSNVIKDLDNSSIKSLKEKIKLGKFPDGFRDDKKKFVLVMTAACWSGMTDETYG